ncbi:hypothetical protein Q5Y75_22790 [Ruegeria sp. 2205SS24-7]|uniref:hypothetical protein n=1 Tax=Ruegeria discodermiae TaxID=3064389 RepID=UPI00274242FC|nr:hypothetical protein [Ruegeria sp. 2205SS24-7]MDP5220041.1 hypothetical protein [Ruegeria sp. 2205SS24-7]
MSFLLSEREVVLKSWPPDRPLKEVVWVTLVAKGFETNEEAAAFGEHLKTSVAIVCLATKQGVDMGEGNPTSSVNEAWLREQGALGQRERLVDDIHGLTVVPDDDLNKIMHISGKGSVTAAPGLFVESMHELEKSPSNQPKRAILGVHLLNFACMNPEALAKAVLAFSAVEELGQGEGWSEKQRALINELASQLEESGAGDVEKLEIADGLRRSFFRLSLRQGVKRVLEELGLADQIREWDRLYSIRSGLFHGTTQLSATETSKFANEALDFCGRIILLKARQEGVQIPEIANSNFGDF